MTWTFPTPSTEGYEESETTLLRSRNTQGAQDNQGTPVETIVQKKSTITREVAG